MNTAIKQEHPSQPCRHRMAHKLIPALISACLLFGVAAVQAAPILPVPESTYDGIPVAQQHNDFYSYSGGLLHQCGFIGTSDYQGGGTGGLDLILGTGASGQDNTGVGPGGAYSFENPMPFPGGSATSMSGTWGEGTQDNGPVMVDNLLSYLQAFDPTHSIPVFIFDHNQTGSASDLWARGEVYIWDPATGTKVAQWFFDDGTGGYVESSGEISVTGDSGETYTVNNNLGSGRIDFLAYAPTMDLSLYAGNDYWFVGEFEMMGLNNGFEELFLTGRFGTTVVQIPEPGTLALMGMGLLGLGWMRRKV